MTSIGILPRKTLEDSVEEAQGQRKPYNPEGYLTNDFSSYKDKSKPFYLEADDRSSRLKINGYLPLQTDSNSTYTSSSMGDSNDSAYLSNSRNKYDSGEYN